MRMSKVGGSIKKKNAGFTLLELLSVIALMGILSFSVLYGFKERATDPLRRGQEIITKLILGMQRMAVLNNSESRIMVLNNPKSADHQRLITTMVREEGFWKSSGIYVMLPEGVRLIFEKYSRSTMSEIMHDKEDSWNYIEFSGVDGFNHRMKFILLDESMNKVSLKITGVGGIEIDG